MKTLLLLTIALTSLLLLASCGDSNGGPSGPGPGGDDEAFFPMAVGNTWNYDRSGTMQMDTITCQITGKSVSEITGTETHADSFEVYVEEFVSTDTLAGQPVPDSTCVTYMRLASDGVHGYPNLENTDSSFVVPFPLEVGNTWQYSEDPPMTGEILSMGGEVTVPAGTFSNVMQMRTTWIQSGLTVVNTTDFAPDVGIVRNVYDQTASFLEYHITSELTSYSVAD
ncbi:hypothetical protein GF402_09915 [Candidatus Fermentibacteria bacterium]|nr:hypothetical protein [Candidatus Fermentibacteria bacterium]